MASSGLPQSAGVQLNKIQNDYSTNSLSRTSHRFSQSLNDDVNYEDVVVYTVDKATAAHQLQHRRKYGDTDDITVMSE